MRVEPGLLAGDDGTAAAVRRAVVLGRGVGLARDLTNEPGGPLTPVEFARRTHAGPRRQGHHL